MSFVRRGHCNVSAVLASKLLDFVGVQQSEKPDLGTEAAQLACLELRVPGVGVVGVIGVEHQFGVTYSQRCEVDIDVVDLGLEDLTRRLSERAGSKAPYRNPGIQGTVPSGRLRGPTGALRRQSSKWFRRLPFCT
jgi:hypothetical protein